LLEREPVLATLAQYAEECRAGEGRLVLLAGEAGSGKSTVVEEFAARTSGLGWLTGRCDGLSTPRPLGPLHDVAAVAGGPLLEACRRRAGRDELFSTLLGTLTSDGPTVLLIEDLHWADESTLDLVQFLSRRLRTVPVLVLATYRDDELEAGHPLRLVLGDLVRERTTRRIALAPLSRAAVATLAVGGARAADEVYELTGGNPFLVTEVVQATPDSLPQSARDAVLARLGRLSEPARRAVHGAALVGACFDPDVLSAATGCGVAVLDELVDSGVLVDDGDDLRFRHELTRLAVAGEVPVHRRRALHARILAALLAAGEDDDAWLAYHAEGADDGVAVLHHATRAGRRAGELAAHREAAAQYERALRFVGPEASVATATLLEQFALECSYVDRWDDAAAARHRALAMWRALGDPVREGATLRHLSRTMFRLCRGREAGEYADAAIAVLEPLGPSQELAWAEANRANQRMLDSRFPEAIAAARRAQAMAELFDLPDVLSDALNSEAAALAYLGEPWEASMLRALEVALAAGADEQIGRAYSNITGLYRDELRFADVERYAAECEAFGEQHDLDTYLTCTLGRRTSVLVARGRWDEALALGRPMLRPGAASPVNRLQPLLDVATVLARRGDPAAAELLAEATDHGLGTDEPMRIGLVRLLRIELEWLAGNEQAARAELAALLELAPRLDRPLRGSVATWARRCGVPADVPKPFLPGHAASLAGDSAEAERLWREAGCAYDAALALYDTGTEVGLRAALDRFDALGAVAAVQATRRQMRRVGVRSIPSGMRASTRANPLGLTVREQEVLSLLVSGRTNAAIADELVLSVKTVGHHVSAVLAKLGVPTRRDAVARALELGLLDAS